jgi:anti-sigma factor RsiW
MKHDNSMIGLRDGIRELASEDALDARELAALRRLATGAPENPSRRLWLGAAAGLGVAAIGGWWGSKVVFDRGNAQRLADEIAASHLRATPLDVVSSDLNELRETFASLGFKLLDAAELEDVPGTLVGGRFGSVASVPAAMLRYRQDSGFITVYQARYDAHRHRGAADMDAGEPGVIRYAGGVDVCLCRSQGVLIAVANRAAGMQHGSDA